MKFIDILVQKNRYDIYILKKRKMRNNSNIEELKSSIFACQQPMTPGLSLR